MHSTTRGIIWMITSCFFAAVLVSLVRQASYTQHAHEIVFFRNLFALFFFMPWFMNRGFREGYKRLQADQFRWHAARALCGIGGMLSWFYALTIVPLPMAVALSFTAPLFTALLAIIVFKEKYGFHRWAALVLGFIGVLVILRPGTEAFQPSALIVIISTVFWAFSGIITKRLTMKNDPTLVAFYFTLLVLPLSLPTALMVWQPPTLTDIGWFAAIGFTASIFQITLARSIASTEFAVILPFDFFRLVFVALFAHFFFNETISHWTAIGSAMILAGAAYTSYKNRQHRIRREAQIIPDEIE